MGDYLWDKTGGADPEVERLEDLLGRLAHRPRPLELPTEAGARPRRSFRAARLAAAAALLLAVLAGALVALRHAPRQDASVVELGAPRGQSAPRESAPPGESAPTPTDPPGRDERAARSDERPGRRAVETANRSRRQRRPAAKAGAGRRVEVARVPHAAGDEEGQQAKAQLVYALRLTSAKLGEVRRKVQGEDEARPAPAGRSRSR